MECLNTKVKHQFKPNLFKLEFDYIVPFISDYDELINENWYKRYIIILSITN